MKLYAAVFLLSGIVYAEGCETGWVQRPNTNYCYWFEQSNKSWIAAWDDCDFRGGIFANVGDKDQQDFISDLIMSQTSDVWIGLSDTEVSEGIWRWDGHFCVDYTNWDAGQPSYGNGGKDCLAIKASSFRWDDRSCYDTLPYICMKRNDGPVVRINYNQDCDDNCQQNFPPNTCLGYDYVNDTCVYQVVKLNHTSNGFSTSYVVCDTELPLATTTEVPLTTTSTAATTINTADLPDQTTTTATAPTTRRRGMKKNCKKHQ